MQECFFTEHIYGKTARICGDGARRLINVMGARPGDEVALRDDKGYGYKARILSISGGEIDLEIAAKAPPAGEPDIRAEVFIGVSASERMEYAVQKSVELGACAVVPFFSENSGAKLKAGSKKAARLARIAGKTAKQCGRGIIPRVGEPLCF